VSTRDVYPPRAIIDLEEPAFHQCPYRSGKACGKATLNIYPGASIALGIFMGFALLLRQRYPQTEWVVDARVVGVFMRG